MPKYSYGWKRDLPDVRDQYFTLRHHAPLPNSIDLSDKTLTIYDQGQLGSCTANAGGALFEMIRTINQKPTYVPSRLYVYYNTRSLEGTINYDSGASIRNAIKSLAIFGAPNESLWPYDIERFAEKPPKEVYVEGNKHHLFNYKRVNNVLLHDIQHALALGYPIVAGFSVYESFESEETARTGQMTMPKPGEQMLGGHAVLIVGYCNDHQHFIVRNSWGEQWGDRGFFYAPYAYFVNKYLAADFWTATLAG